MPYFKFYRDRVIEAKNEEEAKEIFCDDSWNFAGEAEVEEVDELGRPLDK